MASIEKLPPQAEAKLRKLRELQAQLENLIRQKNMLLATISELERVISELEKYPDDVEVYKSMGTVLVKVAKPDLLRELKERKESTELKLAAVEKLIGNVESEMKKLEEEVKRLLAGGGSPAGG